MKKIKLSIIVAFAILGASLSAFTEKATSMADGWYGQLDDTPTYTSSTISQSTAFSKCPQNPAKVCAVQFLNNTVVATRTSSHSYPQ